MKTKNTNDELPSYPKHFVSCSCGGERCYCGNDATHKVGEEIPHDEKDSYPEPLKGLSIRHNFTQYVCCQCFTNIMGNAVFCDYTRPAKIERDVVERAKVVRESYCLVCGHEAFQHEIGMNTPQTGRCLEQGCDCISCDTPSRHDLGEEVERLLAETADLNEKLDAVREALGKLTEVAADVRDVEDAVRAERLRIADEIDSAIMAESWAESALTLTRLNSELIEEQTK